MAEKNQIFEMNAKLLEKKAEVSELEKAKEGKKEEEVPQADRAAVRYACQFFVRPAGADAEGHFLDVVIENVAPGDQAQRDAQHHGKQQQQQRSAQLRAKHRAKQQQQRLTQQLLLQRLLLLLHHYCLLVLYGYQDYRNRLYMKCHSKKSHNHGGRFHIHYNNSFHNLWYRMYFRFPLWEELWL